MGKPGKSRRIGTAPPMMIGSLTCRIFPGSDFCAILIDSKESLSSDDTLVVVVEPLTKLTSNKYKGVPVKIKRAEERIVVVLLVL